MNLAEIAQSRDAAVWAVDNKIKIGTELFSFKGHEYQFESLSNRYKRTCDMKATQGGYTLIYVFLTLHGLIYGFYKQGVLYLFPTNDDVSDFSKSRFNPMIQSNRNAIGQYVKSVGRKGTDTAALKKVRDAHLYLRGARLSQIVGDNIQAKESSKLRGIPVDCVIYDEYDLMEEDVREKAFGRMGHSLVQEEHFLSNPTLPDYGIGRMFYEESDQRHWFRRCTCGEWTSAELTFPDCVKIRKDGTGYVACSKCGKEHPRVLGNAGYGEWVAAEPSKSDYMVGRRWSQLTSVYHDPADILEAFTFPKDGKLDDVYRLRLGLPYAAAEDKLRVSDVLACCGQELQRMGHDGPCAMGVDVGRTSHVIIGARINSEQYEIFKIAKFGTGTLEDWNHIRDLAHKFNVKSTVIDIRPYEDAARSYQKSEKYPVYLCEYTENSTQATDYNFNTGIVKVNRTEICDATHRLVTTKGRLILPRFTPEITDFAKQVSNTAKVLEEDKRTKTAIYRYKKVGDGNDHFRHALNYFYLAADSKHVGIASRHKRKKKLFSRVNNNYARA